MKFIRPIPTTPPVKLVAASVHKAERECFWLWPTHADLMARRDEAYAEQAEHGTFSQESYKSFYKMRRMREMRRLAISYQE